MELSGVNGDAMETLTRGLRELGLEERPYKIAAIRRFLHEISLWNPRYGLVAEGEDLVGRHVLDSLAGFPALAAREPRRLADVGSGAGFPGIPLAVWMDGTEFFLIERSGKRAGFLRNAAVSLGLRNVHVLEKPVEEIKPEDARYDVITFRAWSAIDVHVIDAVAPLLAPGGVIAAYKGRRDVVDAEIEGVADRIASAEIVPLTVPGLGDERHLALLIPNARSAEMSR